MPKRRPKALDDKGELRPQFLLWAYIEAGADSWEDDPSWQDFLLRDMARVVGARSIKKACEAVGWWCSGTKWTEDFCRRVRALAKEARKGAT